MSILVLLPESISSATQRLAPVLHDKGLSSRASSPNVRSENGRLLSISSEDSDGIDPVAHGRRLSLAPGLGAGIHMTSNIGHVGSALGFSPPSTAIPGSTSPSKRTKPALPSSPANQDAESKAHHRSNSATRAGIALSGSDALLQSAALKIPRGSIAGPGGTGFTSLAAARRPAAAGDELVNVLRQAGLEGTYNNSYASCTCMVVLPESGGKIGRGRRAFRNRASAAIFCARTTCRQAESMHVPLPALARIVPASVV